MKIISKKVSACVASMPIINSKERTFGPSLNICFVWWSCHIENYRNSIFIVGSNNTLICICSICSNYSVSFQWTFRTLKVRKLQLLRIGHMWAKEVNCLCFWISSWLSFNLPLLWLHIFFLNVWLLRSQRKRKLLNDSLIRFR